MLDSSQPKPSSGVSETAPRADLSKAMRIHAHLSNVLHAALSSRGKIRYQADEGESPEIRLSDFQNGSL